MLFRHLEVDISIKERFNENIMDPWNTKRCRINPCGLWWTHSCYGVNPIGRRKYVFLDDEF